MQQGNHKYKPNVLAVHLKVDFYHLLSDLP